ncbi:MAG: antibiotic biosynthesis monooxygenase, partial [Novosphingobium sp.]|nr:antibiotic biosynthesis monooxygenase [Novosphingobium sp.]
MTTILAHVRIKPDRLAQFEDIERDLARATHANEPDCLRYECWRAAEANSYYVLLGFRTAAGFYNHQISPWHEAHLEGLFECFDSFRLEFVDPVNGAGSNLPSTTYEP